MPQRGLPSTFVFTHGKTKSHYSGSYLNKLLKKALNAFNERYETGLSIELYEATEMPEPVEDVTKRFTINQS